MQNNQIIVNPTSDHFKTLTITKDSNGICFEIHNGTNFEFAYLNTKELREVRGFIDLILSRNKNAT